MSENVVIPANKRRAVEALMTPGMSRDDVADAASVTTRTIQRWLHEDDFKAALREAQRDVLQCTYSGLAALGIKAVGVLENALDGDATAEQRRAAGDTLRHLLNMRQSVELDERVAEIEAALRELENVEQGIY